MLAAGRSRSSSPSLSCPPKGVWNEFLHYLIAVPPSEPDLKTLTVGLAGLSGGVRPGAAVEHRARRDHHHHHPHRHRLLRLPALLRPGGGRHRGQGLSPLLRVEGGKALIDTGTCRAVIFDMDGVITDSVPVHRRAWKETFDSFLDEIGSDAPASTRGLTI